MPGVVPSRDEIDATVARMEARLRDLAAPDARRLMDAYRRVSARFAGDLSDPRDISLSRAAALMLVRELTSPGGASRSSGATGPV